MSAVELVERRYLSGLVMEDATTGAPVRGPLRVTSANAKFFLTTGGVYVVSSATGLEAHVDKFESPPSTPPVGSLSLEVSITDPSGFFFPRLVTLDLPRSADPAAGDSVLKPVRVALYRSPRAPVGLNWGVLEASLVDEDSGEPVRNALVRALRQPLHPGHNSVTTLLGVGLLMAGSSGSPAGSPRTIGQLALPIVGIPVVAWSSLPDSSVLISSIAVLLEIVAISASLDVFDPDDFLNAPGITVGPFDVASGRRVNAGILQVPVPS